MRMTQVINKKIRKCCDHCQSMLDKPCAWLSLGNEYCDEIMEANEEIDRLNNVINELEKWLVEHIDEYRNMEQDAMFEFGLVLGKLKELKGEKNEKD